MKKAESKRSEAVPEKYVTIAVNGQPAPSDVVETHLRAFVKAFIQPRARHRWEYCLLTKPRKAQECLMHFHLDLEPSRCRLLQGAEGYPLRLASTLEDRIGLYFDSEASALLVTAAEAATLATEHEADAVFSLVPGECALCFGHEGDVLLCERKLERIARA